MRGSLVSPYTQPSHNRTTVSAHPFEPFDQLGHHDSQLTASDDGSSLFCASPCQPTACTCGAPRHSAHSSLLLLFTPLTLSRMFAMSSSAALDGQENNIAATQQPLMERRVTRAASALQNISNTAHLRGRATSDRHTRAGRTGAAGGADDKAEAAEDYTEDGEGDECVQHSDEHANKHTEAEGRSARKKGLRREEARQPEDESWARMRSRNSDDSMRVRVLTAQLRQSTADEQRLQEQMDELTELNEQLRRYSELRADHHDQQRRQLEHSNQQLQQQLAALEGMYALRSSRVEQREDDAMADERLSEAADEQRQLQNEVGDEAGQLQRAQHDIAQPQQQVQQLQAEKNQLMCKYEADLQRLQQRVDELTRDKEQADKLCEQLRRGSEVRAGEHEQQRQQLQQELQAKAQQLQRTERERYSAHAELAVRTEELRSIKLLAVDVEQQMRATVAGLLPAAEQATAVHDDRQQHKPSVPAVEQRLHPPVRSQPAAHTMLSALCAGRAASLSALSSAAPPPSSGRVAGGAVERDESMDHVYDGDDDSDEEVVIQNFEEAVRHRAPA